MFTIYTAMFGRNNLKDVPFVPGIPKVVFTDQDITAEHWLVCKVPRQFLSDRREARKWKILCHVMNTDKTTVWLDDRITPLDPLFDAVENLKGEIGVFKHPDRDCVYKEESICLDRKLEGFEDIEDQMENYFNEGYPQHNGLHETGVLIRRPTETVKAFTNEWWSRLSLGSVRDQLSFGPSLWSLGLEGIVETLPSYLRQSSLVKWDKPMKPVSA